MNVLTPYDLAKEPKTDMKKTINIYLNKQDRKKVDELKVKYRLSLTTIIDQLLQITTIAFMVEENGKDLIKALKNEYIHKKGAKTSIKTPKLFKNDSEWTKDAHLSRYTTNVLKIYINKEADKYIKNKDRLKKYYNECNERFTTTIDNWWNYNEALRYQRRMLRENKEYFRKAMEQ